MGAPLPRGLIYKSGMVDPDGKESEDSQQPQKPKKQSSQIATELSDMVIYVQVRKSVYYSILHKVMMIHTEYIKMVLWHLLKMCLVTRDCSSSVYCDYFVQVSSNLSVGTLKSGK